MALREQEPIESTPAVTRRQLPIASRTEFGDVLAAQTTQAAAARNFAQRTREFHQEGVAKAEQRTQTLTYAQAHGIQDGSTIARRLQKVVEDVNQRV